MPNTVYFDESGNTGDNLLDKDQPTYTLASHDFTEDEAMDILTPLRLLSNAQEIHYKRVKKYTAHKNALLACFNNPLVMENRVYCFGTHKRYLVCVHLVDKLLETVFYEAGYDIYKREQNIAYANIVYILGNSDWPLDRFDKLCASFIDWVRSGDVQKSEAFYEALEYLGRSLKHAQDFMLLDELRSSRKYASIITSGFDKFVLDATLPCFVSHVYFYAKHHKDSIDAVLDPSKQIDHWQGMIEFLKSMPEKEVGTGCRKHRFPLPVNIVSTVDSKSDICIQLADLFASAGNDVYTNRFNGKQDSFVSELFHTRFGLLSGNDIWPGTSFPTGDLEPLGGADTNPLDFFAQSAVTNPAGFKKAWNKK